MTRHRSEFLEHASSVPLLVANIELAGRAALARQIDAVDREAISSDAMPMPIRTIYAALGHELGQSAEGLRVELHKWRQARVPGARKVVRLVDAAVRLGWIHSDAAGSGAEALIKWCREEVKRLDAEARESALRRTERARGEGVSAIRQACTKALDASLEDATQVLSVELIRSAVECVRDHYVARDDWEGVSAIFAEVARRVADLGNELAVQGARAREEDAVFRRAMLQEQDDANLVQNFWERAGDPKVLRETALSLGIGGDQLRRILANLRDGKRLSSDDFKRRGELLDRFTGLRPIGEWRTIK